MRSLSLAEPSLLFRPSILPCDSLLTRQHGVTGLTVPPSFLPDLGHNSALLQMHQLQAELEALRTLKAEEAAAVAEQEDLLRLRGPLQAKVLSVSESHVSPSRACVGATARCRAGAESTPEEAAVGTHGRQDTPLHGGSFL